MRPEPSKKSPAGRWATVSGKRPGQTCTAASALAGAASSAGIVCSTSLIASFLVAYSLVASNSVASPATFLAFALVCIYTWQVQLNPSMQTWSWCLKPVAEWC